MNHLDDQQQHYIRNYRRMQRGLPTATDILHLTRSVLVQQNVPPEPPQLGDFLRIRLERDINDMQHLVKDCHMINRWGDPILTLGRNLHLRLLEYLCYSNLPNYGWCILKLMCRQNIRRWLFLAYDQTVRILKMHLGQSHNYLTGRSFVLVQATIHRYSHHTDLIYQIVREVIPVHLQALRKAENA